MGSLLNNLFNKKKNNQPAETNEEVVAPQSKEESTPKTPEESESQKEVESTDTTKTEETSAETTKEVQLEEEQTGEVVDEKPKESPSNPEETPSSTDTTEEETAQTEPQEEEPVESEEQSQAQSDVSNENAASEKTDAETETEELAQLETTTEEAQIDHEVLNQEAEVKTVPKSQKTKGNKPIPLFKNSSFGEQIIRRFYLNNQWCFVIDDIIALAGVTEPVQKYLQEIKDQNPQLKNDWESIIQDIHYKINDVEQVFMCANQENSMRIARSLNIPLPGPLSRWLAEMASEQPEPTPSEPEVSETSPEEVSTHLQG